jgi:hypothetical protein
VTRTGPSGARPSGGHLLSLAGTAGTALRGVFAGVSRLRPADKPLHPRGVVLAATVHRYGSSEWFDVPWLDEPGSEPAVVRLSRAAGLPAPLPDVFGLALRINPADRPGDLLFSSTGRGRLGRFLLRPSRGTAAFTTGPYSTLQPYRTPTGPVLLSATPDEDGGALTVRLAAARPTGPWREFGVVVADLAGAEDEPVEFDPFLHPVPGLANYEWTRRIREGAYSAARRSRRR